MIAAHHFMSKIFNLRHFSWVPFTAIYGHLVLFFSKSWSHQLMMSGCYCFFTKVESHSTCMNSTFKCSAKTKGVKLPIQMKDPRARVRVSAGRDCPSRALLSWASLPCLKMYFLNNVATNTIGYFFWCLSRAQCSPSIRGEAVNCASSTSQSSTRLPCQGAQTREPCVLHGPGDT